MTTTEKCAEPPVVMVKLGDKDWAPACENHLADAREASAAAGKKPPPKGASKTALAAHSAANRDDVLPIHVRPLTSVERQMEPPCLISSLGA